MEENGCSFSGVGLITKLIRSFGILFQFCKNEKNRLNRQGMYCGGVSWNILSLRWKWGWFSLQGACETSFVCLFAFYRFIHLSTDRIYKNKPIDFRKVRWDIFNSWRSYARFWHMLCCNFGGIENQMISTTMNFIIFTDFSTACVR